MAQAAEVVRAARDEAIGAGDVAVERFLAESVALDDFDLDAQMQRIPGDLAYWGERHARAVGDHLAAEHEERVARAAARLRIREEARDAGGKGPTVDDLAAMVEVDPEVRSKSEAAILAEVERVRCRAAVEAVAAKRDMAQSLGAKRRLEMAADPRIRAMEDQRRAVREGE